MVDSTSGGSFMMKEFEEARELVENMVPNQSQWHSQINIPKKPERIYEIDVAATLHS